MTTIRAAFYARVSGEQQAAAHTIESQVAAPRRVGEVLAHDTSNPGTVRTRLSRITCATTLTAIRAQCHADSKFLSTSADLGHCTSDGRQQKLRKIFHPREQPAFSEVFLNRELTCVTKQSVCFPAASGT
jgi:hypothetical protein